MTLARPVTALLLVWLGRGVLVERVDAEDPVPHDEGADGEVWRSDGPV